MQFAGLHHITAMTENAQTNVDFYTKVLGLRMIKQTVNFDDPQTYHLYYGDYQGSPGTALTFFPFGGIRHGTRGNGQAVSIAFIIPASAISYWQQRLSDFGIVASDPTPHFGNEVIRFNDPDGMLLELVGVPDEQAGAGWQNGAMQAAHTIRGFYGTSMQVGNPDSSVRFLTDVLGFRELAREGQYIRLSSTDGAPGTILDVIVRPELSHGQMGAGTIHHIAWRATDDRQQLAWREQLLAAGASVTPVRDRQYFHSIYFYEPGGVLFEIATDGPGFTIDEPLETLGTTLQLPPWYEPQRAQIERVLPPLTLPEVPA